MAGVVDATGVKLNSRFLTVANYKLPTHLLGYRWRWPFDVGTIVFLRGASDFDILILNLAVTFVLTLVPNASIAQHGSLRPLGYYA